MRTLSPSPIHTESTICLIIGDPVSHSLSPRMHGAGYRATGLADSFVYGASRVSTERLPDAIAGIRSLGIRGVSVTMPHKEAVIPLLDELDKDAHELGAVNTIVNKNGMLIGYNTDWFGIATPLADALKKSPTAPANHSALILGAGGAARAAAFALRSLSIPFTITSRNEERAAIVAARFGGSTCPWDDRHTVRASIFINTTPLGMPNAPLASPISPTVWSPTTIAFETVSVPRETHFLTEARSASAFTIQGISMLLWQGVKQFELFTGHPAPVDAMREALG
jgi:shikimate dehydrogenase